MLIESRILIWFFCAWIRLRQEDGFGSWVFATWSVWMWTIDKQFTQKGKVFCLPLEWNLLLSFFRLSALYSRIFCNRWPSLPAWHLLTMVLQGTEWQGSVRLNLIEDASAPSLFPSSCISYLWCGPSTAQMKRNIYNHYHNACTQRKKCGVISMEIIKYRKADGTGVLLMLLKFKALATVQ